MFAKITKTFVDRRGSAAPVRATAFRASRDARDNNRPGRGLAAATGRASRDRLACRWRLAPATGMLECVWYTDTSGAAAGEEPALRCKLRAAA